MPGLMGVQDVARAFPGLSSLRRLENGEKLHICLVTPELAEAGGYGDTGTACACLAFALAEDGHKVEILLTMPSGVGCDCSKKIYDQRGIYVGHLQAEAGCGGFFPDCKPLIRALEVYDWLGGRPEFDLIIFMDWQGGGFYALHAKKCGLDFERATMVVILQRSSMWHSLNNASTPENPIEACLWHMERSCVEMADAIISPGAYMLNWCLEHGYRLPNEAYEQPNLLEPELACAATQDSPIREIVFFGRLEYRKGLVQFCSSLDILASQGMLPAKVTFLGKCGLVGHEHCLVYISRHSEKWKNCQTSFLLHYDRNSALEYLRGSGRLAIMPSVADNFPYTVYECLVGGIPFLARGVDGIKELVCVEDRAKVLFDDHPGDLAQKIAHALGKPAFRARLNFDLPGNKKAWQSGLPAMARRCAMLRSRRHEQPIPFISVCLIHYNRPELLRQAVNSFLKQKYKNFEIILADDGSDLPLAKQYLKELEPVFRQKDWHILHLENGYAGRARNMAARMARGEWLLFFDDDNLAMPNMLEKFARAAACSGASLITCSFSIFDGPGDRPEKRESRFLPLGKIFSYSILNNAIGDTASLIRKDIFLKYGGFGEDYGIGHQDFELFSRVMLGGEKIGVIPDALFWYRRGERKTSIVRQTNNAVNRLRSLRPFMEMLPPELAETVYMAHGLAVGQNFCGDAKGATCHINPSVDPQEEAVLEEIAANLQKMGHETMARNILQSCHMAWLSKVPRLDCLCQKIMAAVEKADITGLTAAITDFNACMYALPQNISKNAVAEICLYIIRAMGNEKIFMAARSALEDVLRHIGKDSISAHLYFCLRNYHVNCEASIISFLSALAIAESAYVNKRPDVEKAIKERIFACGLQHFIKYGRAEGFFWPKNNDFISVLNKIEDIMGKLEAAHQFMYKYARNELSENIFKIWASMKN